MSSMFLFCMYCNCLLFGKIAIFALTIVLKMLQDLEPCRLCAEYNKSMSSISLFEKSRKAVLQRIFQLTGVKLKRISDIPSIICLDCEEDLNRAHEFRRRCISAQTYFSSSEYKTRSEQQKDEQRKMKIDETLSELKKVRHLTFTNGKNKKEMKIKDKKNLSMYNEKSTCKQTEFIAIDEVDYTDNECKDPIYDDSEVSVEKPTDDCTAIKLERDDTKKHKAVIEYEATVIESKPEAINIQHPKKSNNAKRKPKEKQKDQQQTHLICDQCGNHFTNRCHFYTHIKRHTGVKTIQCEVCPDKFFTGGELKRHMRRHTGERPFACKHCQRRFTDNSTRVKHERTHTNERPFKCPHCDKAFTTGYILKNHMLVHTGERSFICVPCNKSFQRQTILDVHTRSLAHKQNVEREQR